MSINAHQPTPKQNVNEAVWDLVISDMKDRDQVGRERYGTPLQGFNGRDALVDAYQESLDLVVYLRQAIWERDFSKDECVTEYPEVVITPTEVKVVEQAGTIVRKPFVMTSENTFL